MKPCVIQVFDYYRPKGPRDDRWRCGDRCKPQGKELALLCDSEAHAEKILAALERVVALEDEVSLLRSKLRSAEDRIAAMIS